MFVHSIVRFVVILYLNKNYKIIIKYIIITPLKEPAQNYVGINKIEAKNTALELLEKYNLKNVKLRKR